MINSTQSHYLHAIKQKELLNASQNHRNINLLAQIQITDMILMEYDSDTIYY